MQCLHATKKTQVISVLNDTSVSPFTAWENSRLNLDKTSLLPNNGSGRISNRHFNAWQSKCFKKSETMKLPPSVKGSTQPLAAIQLMGNNAAGSLVTLSLHLETSVNGISIT